MLVGAAGIGDNRPPRSAIVASSRSRATGSRPDARLGMMGGLIVGLLQLLLVIGLLADPATLVREPIRNLDYAAHFYNAVRAGDHLRSSGRLWGYDPFWMAGYPQGFVALIDDKFFCVLLRMAPRGWEALVFNAGVLAILLGVPWFVYAAAGMAGLDTDERCGAAVAAVVATFSVPASVLFWSWGGLSFFFAAVLAVPVTLALARTLNDGSLGSPRGLLGTLAAMLTTFVHPVAAGILAMGLTPLLWNGRRRVSMRIRDLLLLGALLGVTVLPILEASAWLRGPLRFSHPAHEAFRGGLHQLGRDWWTHLFDTTNRRDGAGGLLAIVPLALWGALCIRRRHRDERYVSPIAAEATAIAAIGCAATAYVLSSLTERAVSLQPYRFIIPMAFFACIPAGVGVARLRTSLAAGRAVAWVVVAVVCLIMANAARGLAPMMVLGHGRDPAEVELADFLRRETAETDRVLVESRATPLWIEGPIRRAVLSARFALLPLAIHRELVGWSGVEPFVAHRYARFDGELLLGQRFSDVSEQTLGTALGRYAITWVVGCDSATLAKLEGFSGLLEARATAADCRIFRVRDAQSSRFREGSGRVSADVDRIAVNDAAGDRVVLKYHWVPTLRTDPPLPIEEAREPGMPVGFIAVRPRGVRDFTIRPRGIFEAPSSAAP
jgi:hypothetical protein